MARASIAKRIAGLELEMRVLRSRLEERAPKTRKKRAFARLRGIWKKYGDFTCEDIKSAEVRLPDDHSLFTTQCTCKTAAVKCLCGRRLPVLGRRLALHRELGGRTAYVFDWNPEKARSNLRRHEVSFEEASTVFGDPLALLMSDPDHSQNEERYLLLGVTIRRRLVVVAFAERPPLTRLISARRATRTERREYEEEGMPD